MLLLLLNSKNAKLKKKKRTTRTAQLDKVFGYDKFHGRVTLWHCKHAPRRAPAWFLPASCRDTSCTTSLSPNINKVANNSTSGQMAHPKPTGAGDRRDNETHDPAGKLPVLETWLTETLKFGRKRNDAIAVAPVLAALDGHHRWLMGGGGLPSHGRAGDKNWG